MLDPPSLDDVPAGLREDLRSLQALNNDALWAVARSRLASTQRARLEVLMTRHIVSLATERGDTDKCRPVYVCTGVCYRFEVEELLHTEDNLALEENHPLHAPKERAGGDVDQRRALDRRVTLTQAVDVQLIGPGRRQRLIRHSSVPG